MTNKQTGRGGTLKITGTVDLGRAEELHKMLTEHVRRKPAPAIDLSGVETWDASALQLLYAAKRTATEAGKSLRIVAVSPAVTEVSAALGLPVEVNRGNESGL